LNIFLVLFSLQTGLVQATFEITSEANRIEFRAHAKRFQLDPLTKRVMQSTRIAAAAASQQRRRDEDLEVHVFGDRQLHSLKLSSVCQLVELKIRVDEINAMIKFEHQHSPPCIPLQYLNESGNEELVLTTEPMGKNYQPEKNSYFVRGVVFRVLDRDHPDYDDACKHAGSNDGQLCKCQEVTSIAMDKPTVKALCERLSFMSTVEDTLRAYKNNVALLAFLLVCVPETRTRDYNPLVAEIHALRATPMNMRAFSNATLEWLQSSRMLNVISASANMDQLKTLYAHYCREFDLTLPSASTYSWEMLLLVTAQQTALLISLLLEAEFKTSAATAVHTLTAVQATWKKMIEFVEQQQQKSTGACCMETDVATAAAKSENGDNEDANGDNNGDDDDDDEPPPPATAKQLRKRAGGSGGGSKTKSNPSAMDEDF
jgi:hypothetical protein